MEMMDYTRDLVAVALFAGFIGSVAIAAYFITKAAKGVKKATDKVQRAWEGQGQWSSHEMDAHENW